MESFIMKWTLGIVFFGVTLIFLGKIGGLLYLAGKIKLAVFLKAHPWLETIGGALSR